jgi:2-desacetyl-2-hydroxyethyl bacteriochlorophyllide A dehydrogenase
MPDMVSLALDGPRSIDMQRKPMPLLEDNCVRVEAVVTGVSAGTERMWYGGTNPAIKSGRRGYPYYPGYEFVGRVVETGTDVLDIEAGELVFAMKPHGSHAILGPDDYWAVLPDDLDPDDAVATALTATNVHALHRAGTLAGDAVAVIGMGTLGLLCCQVLRATGAGEVIAISRSARKRELALELGASLALDPADPELTEQVLGCTGDRGVDVAMEWAGVDSAVHTALRVVRNQGRVVVGGFHVEPFSVSGEIFFAKEITVHSVRGSGSMRIATASRSSGMPPRRTEPRWAIPMSVRGTTPLRTRFTLPRTCSSAKAAWSARTTRSSPSDCAKLGPTARPVSTTTLRSASTTG